MLSFGSHLQEVWTGEAAEEVEAGGVCGRSTTAGELAHRGELFTVSRSVVSLLHTLTTAALYPLPKSYPVYLVNHSVVSLLLSLTGF